MSSGDSGNGLFTKLFSFIINLSLKNKLCFEII